MRPFLPLLAGLALAAGVAAAQTPPEGTVGAQGGLNFASALVAETFAGVRPSHTQQASLRPGRIVVETSPAHVRSGQTSVRMQLQPGDCGARIGGGAPDDCANGNERIEINMGPSSGTVLYGFSLQLGDDFGQIRGPSAVNLVQWFQQGAGACFNVQYDVRDKRLYVRNRCAAGGYNAGPPQDTSLRAPAFGRWNEFVVLARWSKGEDGLFRVLVNDELAYDWRGATLAPEGADQVSERFSILRFEGLGRIPVPSTLWLDDVVASGRVADIAQRYAFTRANLGVQ